MIKNDKNELINRNRQHPLAEKQNNFNCVQE